MLIWWYHGFLIGRLLPSITRLFDDVYVMHIIDYIKMQLLPNKLTSYSFLINIKCTFAWLCNYTHPQYWFIMMEFESIFPLHNRLTKWLIFLTLNKLRKSSFKWHLVVAISLIFSDFNFHKKWNRKPCEFFPAIKIMHSFEGHCNIFYQRNENKS